LNLAWRGAGAAVLGALQTLVYAHTAWWPLPLLCVVGLVALLQGQRPLAAAWLGWCFGTAWLCAGTWWLFISMHQYGGLAAPLAALAVFVLSGALSLYLAASCAAYAAFSPWRRSGPLAAVLFAAVWLLAELARGVIFTGFPWLAVGYSQLDGPVAALAPWVGVYGMGALLAFVAVAVWQLLHTRGRDWPALALGAGVLAVAHIAPSDFTTPAGELDVTLLQSNIKQSQKFDAGYMPQALAWTARELQAATTPLVMAPETTVPLTLDQLETFAPGYWGALRAHFAVPGRAALVGIPLGDIQAGYTNSVAGLSADAPAPFYRYDKEHLVPFGEFIPTGFRWFTELMNIPLGDFARGVRVPPSFVVQGQRVAPNICYEDLFGEELARRFGHAAQAPTIFANVSNIGWFGPSDIIAQHLHISRLRSLEFQRPMLRATNTGATAIITHQGVVAAQLAPYTQGVLTGRVQGRVGNTPYAWWAGRFGLWPLGLLATLVLAAVGGSAWARRAPIR
jgi:apolipoprotein N-acyltransferase